MLRQGITEISESKKYPIGLRYAKDDRVFRYARVGDCDGPATPWAAGVGRPIEYGIPLSFGEGQKEVATIVSGPAGSFRPVVTLAVDVNAGNLENGYFTLFSAAGGTVWGCKILGCTGAAAGNNVTLTLESPLPVTLDAADTVTVMACPYSNVIRHSGAAGDIYQAIIGLPMFYAAAPGLDIEGQFIWVQTWGPYANPQISKTHEGASPGERCLWFQSGGLQCEQAAYTTEQIAGYYIPESQANMSSPIVWLTIAP